MMRGSMGSSSKEYVTISNGKDQGGSLAKPYDDVADGLTAGHVRQAEGVRGRLKGQL